jgi:hypothetical protein
MLKRWLAKFYGFDARERRLHGLLLDVLEALEDGKVTRTEVVALRNTAYTVLVDLGLHDAGDPRRKQPKLTM